MAEDQRPMISVKDPWSNEVHQCSLDVCSYASDPSVLALQLTTNIGEPYAVMSTNIDADESLFAKPGRTFLDINNLPCGVEIVAEHKLATPVKDHSGHPIAEFSGFCEYPLYQFDLKALRKYDPDGVANYLAGHQTDQRIRQAENLCPDIRPEGMDNIYDL